MPIDKSPSKKFSDAIGYSDASPIPTEAQEQTWLFQWARMQSGTIKELSMLYHIPNGGSRNHLEAIHLKQQGVQAGVPDLCLPVARGGCHSLYIELKRTKGGRVSREQTEWMEALMQQGHMVAVCQGWKMASDVIMNYLRGKRDDEK